MILDQLTTFATNAAIDNAAASNIVGDVYDSGGEGINMADIYLNIGIDTAVAGGNTVEFSLVAGNSPTVTTGDTVVASSGAIPVAGLTAGAKAYSQKFPVGKIEGRYYAIMVTRVGAGTAGSFTASLTPVVPANRAYPEGNN